MPIYEYQCKGCGRRSTFLVLKPDEFQAVCKQCGGTQLTRLISRVSSARSNEDRLERLADPERPGGIDGNDPRFMARWMKKVGKEMGEDVGEDFDQMVDEAMEKDAGGVPQASEEDFL